MESIDIFYRWREAVGFSHGFPRLKPLLHPGPKFNALGNAVRTEDSDRFFVNGQHLDKLKEIYDSIGTSKVVLTAVGHGATTLARYMYDRSEQETLTSRSIPVLISIEGLLVDSYEMILDKATEFLGKFHPKLSSREFSRDFDSLKDEADELALQQFGKITPRLCKESIEAKIRLAVVQSLATQPWERKLPRTLYRDLIGSRSASQSDLEDRRKELDGFLTRLHAQYGERRATSEDFWNSVKSASPTLARDYHEIIRELAKEGRVRISLLLDLSATPVGRQYLGESEGEYLTEPYKNTLKSFNAAVKNIEQESEGKPEPILPSLLDKTYFLSTRAWSLFSAELKAREDDRIIFPACSSMDVYAMLAYHYPPSLDVSAGRRIELLAAVLGSSIIKIKETRAISSEMVLVEAELIKEAVECYQQNSSGVRLAERVGEEISKAKVEPAQVAQAAQLAVEFEKLLKEHNITLSEFVNRVHQMGGNNRT